jgi:hypothetical protein
VGPFEVAPDETLPEEAVALEVAPLGFAAEEEPHPLAPEAALGALAAGDGGTIDLEPNVIKGTARLTNQNPEILALLAADPWHRDGGSNASAIASASANSTKPSGYSGVTTTIQFKNPSEYSFALLVEASAGGDAGVVYTVGATRGNYGFPSAAGVVVRPRAVQPNPTEVKLEGCIGAIQFEFGTDETCQTPSPAFVSASLQRNNLSFFRLPNQQRYALYAAAGSSVKTTLFYNFLGLNGRTYAAGRPVEWEAACDQLVRVCTPIQPDVIPRPQGDITGPWEVFGETSTFRRNITARYLALAITRSHVSSTPTSPVSSPSTWWTMSPTMDEGDWVLRGSGHLRKGREFTHFATPDLSPATPAGPVTVIANQVTPVTKVVAGETRHAFAMHPAYFYGAIRLADPSIPLLPGSRSTLESLYFEADHDSNGDGIPNEPNIGTRGTFLRAVTAENGFSYTAFPRSFDRTSGELASTYEQPLPSPYDLPLTWTQDYLRLNFWSQGASPNTRPGMYDEERFRYGYLSLNSPGRSVLLEPTQRKRIDHEYCFNEVQLQYATSLGRFYNPFADVNGTFTGKDWRDVQLSYTASGRFYGTPAIWGFTPLPTETSQEGAVSLVLPQGTYTLKPGAYMMGDDGSVNTATFAHVSVTLGCGQRVKIVPPLSVSISSASGCATGPVIPISGVVKSKPAAVDRIWYRLNDGPEVPVCTNCGIDPAYAFSLPLQACHNNLKVFAYSEGMPQPAVGMAEFVWDDPADGPTCPNSHCINRPPVARCRSVTVAADSACGGCASVDDGSYDPNENDTLDCVQTPGCPYALGSRKVTLTCTDRLGLTSSCEATVTVQDVSPPVLSCPAQTPVLECQEGGAVATYATTATDNCGSITPPTCSPPSGCSFPLGTTQVACTATDAAGNTGSCAIPVTVQDTQPPTLSCPAPVTAECVGGAAQVTPPTATAGDTCALVTVTGPSAGSFPLGSSPVTYTATDAAGQQVSCTSSIDVLDTQPPSLVLNGQDVLTLACGTGTPYSEQGATASDVCGGDLSAQVLISGTVNTAHPGSYTVNYSVADGSGHTATAARTVHVVADPALCASAGQWAATGSMANVRLQHTTTLLPSGKVLAVGGYSWATELYDPASGTWAATGKAIATHREHTATLLPDGRVLVAGGEGSKAGAFAEVYDPAAGMWLPTSSMATARRGHTATLLPSGKVLVVGGGNDGGLVQSSAELYDPVSGVWTAAGGLATARRGHTATLLPEGGVLITGGSGGSGALLASAELYEPASGTWTAVGGMSTARRFHTATLLPSGKVLVVGGAGTHALSSTTELYDPATGSWTAAGNLRTARRSHTTTVLADGRVLVAAGYNQFDGILTSAELYNACGDGWCPAGHLGVPRYGHTTTVLADGRVLVTAGFSNQNQASAEVYTP